MLSQNIINQIEGDYEIFLEDIGTVHSCIKVTPEIEKDLQGLPEELIYFWKKHGICSYVDGLWWHTNPRDYDGVVEDWLKDTPYWEPDTNRYHVIGRTAYGTLTLWGEKTGTNIEIDPLMGIIYHSESDEKYLSEGEAWIPVTGFISGGMSKDDYDVMDDNDKPMFKRIHKKLGPLQSHEMYTAVPMPMLSGGISVKNAQKEDLFIQLDLIRQAIETPEIIDFAEWDKELGL